MSRREKAGNAQELSPFRPGHPEFRYENYPIYWVARVANLYTHLLERSIKPEGVTVTGWRILMILREHESMSISQIAADASVKLSTVTKTVYTMRDKDLLVVRPRERDARVTEAEITGKGLALLEAILASASHVFEAVLKDFDSEEIETYNDYSKRICERLERLR